MMLKTSTDGYIRLSLSELETIPLHLLVAGKYDEVSGFTEFASEGLPAISIGWDWEWRIMGGKLRPVRVGEPLCNLLLLDASGCLGAAGTAQELARFVDNIEWIAPTLGYLATVANPGGELNAS
ncbi:protein of unknown function [Duganella sp. CF458]|uniref:DUF4902 domain-containing protein n=1 Tax=Duganella sp. CF458 TaxID=1884368 RepID=UPI0008E95BF1|nr:DUF4902 domain-containing protein [Duganella sp. CF458]SFH02438.1 protein of unknown function [Duganella sp. CF458]